MWHGDDVSFRIHHTIDRAAVYADNLSLQGRLNAVRAFTDYGVKVNSAVDDTGKQLDFRSYQLFWMKAMLFELEFEAPSPTAQTVSVDVEFRTRSGKQRVRTTLALDRTGHTGYRTQLGRWQRQDRAQKQTDHE